MLIESSRQEWRFAELVGAVPLSPIEDERSYSQALKLLDRLFLLKRKQNRDESVYFQALAELVYEYETRHARESGPLDRVDYLDHRLQGECLQAEQRGGHAQCGPS
jgi:antitoxin component HigA of HigAB toxin-antitoxin module